ncbi:class I SAM-dependent methyltransferase [Polluticoccus soli]|uniref:class I SAM-dependent methyltransferase n=1 Tax=Polluticoccus soli TaxID=3034150 RepID=UPI0023E2B2AE|nr:class I SAM-dependent methyltransferase [Flavipsychrobacter sp. JY13-12]
MTEILYDTIGKAYNATRCADPYIAGRVFELLSPRPDGLYLDIGCGTANYLTALAEKGVKFYGVDPSETMLAEARKKDNGAQFFNAKAEALPFGDEFFDGCTATFTLHHWDNKLKGLKEVNRVLKPGSKIVFLSFCGEQMRGYWLNHYFPEMMKRSWELLPELPEMELLLNNAGFQLATIEKYFVQEDLQDHFVYSNKHRPEQYLRPEIRANASSFAAFCSPEELTSGLTALEADIVNRRIYDIMKSYENDKGDYIFLVAQK